MCGIYLTNFNYSENEVQSKLETIKFRGPDHTGILKKGDLIFGHLRLSIIDLDERSNQPMCFDEYTIVFNGEIYNFQEIRNSLTNLGYTFNTTGDTEVLIKGFKEWGEDLVPKLNGMFAFVIHNSKTNMLFCSRDRLGVKPFYYYWKDGHFEICSQLRPISSNKTLNEYAISMFLDCTYIPSPYTIYNDVHKLPPGNNLYFDLNEKSLLIKEYWNLKKVNPLNLTYKEATNHIHSLLKDAVRIRLQSDVPFGTFLSGGIDSALITSIATKVSTGKIKTFSIGFEDPKYDESIIAKQYSKILNTEHTETVCKPSDILEMIPKLIEAYDEPFADSSALPSLLLNKVTGQYVTMALSGDGGDESFLGYNHFELVTKMKKVFIIPYRIRRLMSSLIVFNLFGKRSKSIKRVLQIKTLNNFISEIFIGFNSILKNRDLRWLSHYRDFESFAKNDLQRTADLNIKLWLENDSNVKVDRASMAYSVEVRSPFLDYRVIEVARNLPVSFRYIPGRRKRILRDILKQYIPEKIFNQPKKGFSIPIGAWIRNELKEEFIENLSDDFLLQVPNLDVTKFKKMFNDHLKGKEDYSSYIWRLYVLSKWQQEFGFYEKN